MIVLCIPSKKTPPELSSLEEPALPIHYNASQKVGVKTKAGAIVLEKLGKFLTENPRITSVPHCTLAVKNDKTVVNFKMDKKAKAMCCMGLTFTEMDQQLL